MRKHTFLLLFLWGTSLLCAQEPKGAVSAAPLSESRGVTRAVVIGISDYQDPAIPDLQFAHRDAEAFAAWLQSPAGGSVPAGNIQVRLNEKATMGQVAMDLWALMTQCVEGDQVIIYFSGHGDVETRTIAQPGYWLCWDSPPYAYMSGGCFNVRDLQDIVATLSLQNKARVLVISDACHAGKLAGSDIGGPQATAQNLARQFASEVKILSCQPNEFSLEGTQWGGGRGCFSYHLTDGLYGLADRNEDDLVTLTELENYLEDRVPEETAPHRQFPFTIGDKLARLARVDAPTLARIKAGKTGVQPSLEPIDPRGMEDWVLLRADSSIRELYAAFNAALERKELLEPKGTSADDYYRRLINEPELAPVHGLMTRNFAAALVDESQQVTNKLLKTDPQVVSDVLSRPFVFDHIHTYIARAIGLLGEGHFLYKHLRAKQCYFEALTYRSENYPGWPADSITIAFQRKMDEGLVFDSTAAYLHLGIAMYHDFYTYQFPLAIEHGKKAMELAPNCAAAYFFVGNAIANLYQDKAAIPYLEKAIALDSTFLPSYIFLGLANGYNGNHEGYLDYMNRYVIKVTKLIENDPGNSPVFYFSQLGNALWKLGRIREAETVLLEAVEKSKGNAPNAWFNLMCVYIIEGAWQAASDAGEKWLNTSGIINEGGYLGFCYRRLGDTAKAESFYKDKIAKAAILNDTTSIAQSWRFLGDLYQEQERFQEANEAFQNALNLCSENMDIDGMWLTGRALYALKGEQAMLDMAKAHLHKDPERTAVYHMLACNYALAGEQQKALEWLGLGITRDINICWWALLDVEFVPLRQTEGYKTLCRKCFPEGIR